MPACAPHKVHNHLCQNHLSTYGYKVLGSTALPLTPHLEMILGSSFWRSPLMMITHNEVWFKTTNKLAGECWLALTPLRSVVSPMITSSLKYFIDNVCIHVHERFWSVVFLFLNVFVCFDIGVMPASQNESGSTPCFYFVRYIVENWCVISYLNLQ